MKSKLKLLLLVPSLLVTACGYGLKEVYEGVPYASSVFSKNYYDVWNSSIDYRNSSNKITETKVERALDKETDSVFTSFSDVNFRNVEPKWNEYAYTYDKTSTPSVGSKYEGKTPYGPDVSMFKLDKTFKYGVSSKLFDGQMFCNGDFANARTQVRPNDSEGDKGFGLLFSKECSSATYFMMNFKCSVVKEDDQNLSSQSTNLRLHISFYLKNDSGYTRVPLTYELNDVPTNSGDDHGLEPYSGRLLSYVFFGFSLENIDSNRICGLSIQYDLLSDTYSSSHPEEKTLHSVMLYEVSFPHSSWH